MQIPQPLQDAYLDCGRRDGVRIAKPFAKVGNFRRRIYCSPVHFIHAPFNRVRARTQIGVGPQSSTEPLEVTSRTREGIASDINKVGATHE